MCDLLLLFCVGSVAFRWPTVFALVDQCPVSHASLSEEHLCEVMSKHHMDVGGPEIWENGLFADAVFAFKVREERSLIRT